MKLVLDLAGIGDKEEVIIEAGLRHGRYGYRKEVIMEAGVRHSR